MPAPPGRVPPAAISPPRVSTEGSSKRSWAWIVAACWVVGFTIAFYLQAMPNNAPATRLTIWQQLPFHFLDLIDPPPPEPGSLPRGWVYIGQRIPLFGLAGAILLGAWGWGRWVVRWVRLDDHLDRVESLAVTSGLGLVLLATMTLATGATIGLSRPLLALLTWAPLIAWWATHGRRAWAERPREVKPWTRPSIATLVAGLVVFILLVHMLLGAASPQTDFDVKEYHLGGPKEYFEQGHIVFLPHNVYTSFPFLTEMLTLLSMALYGDWRWGALVGQVVLMSFAPITSMGIYAAGRRWFSKEAGLLGAFIHFTTPWVYRISIIAYAEGGLAAYLLLAFLAANRACDAGLDASRRRGWWFVAGLLAGAGMACKYPGLVSVVFPMGLVAVVAARALRSDVTRPAGFDGRSVLYFAAGVALTVGPWLLKNLLETGNPVYPLLYSVFGGVDWDPALNEKWRRAHSPNGYGPLGFLRSIWDVMALNDWQSGAIFALAPIAFLDASRLPRLRTWAAYLAYLVFTWWLLTHRIDRFWVPLIPIAAVLAGVGAAKLWHGRGRPGLVALLVVTTAFNVGISTSGFGGYNAGLTELRAASDFTARLTAPEIAAVNELVRSGGLPRDIRVLAVGEAEIFDAEFSIRYNTVFDRSLFEEWCGRPGESDSASRPLRPADEIRRKFEAEGVTHLLVNWLEILRYRTTYGYTDFAHPSRFAALESEGLIEPVELLPPPFGLLPLKSMQAGERDHVLRWAPELIVRHRGEEYLRTSQFYRVRARADGPPR